MSGRVVYLDAGRGVAALVVLVHHVMVFYGAPIATQLKDQRSLLGLITVVSDLNSQAVMFFFFISGWSILLSLRRVEDGEGRLSWRLYVRHRARRILPLFWISLLWSFILAASVNQANNERSLATLIGNLAFLQTAPAVHGTWFAPFAGNGPLWSLSYEVWYYLALPAVYWTFNFTIREPMKRVETALFLSIGISVVAIGLHRIFPNPFLSFATLWPVWVAGFFYAFCTEKTELEVRAASSIFAATFALWILAQVIHSDTLNALRNGYVVAACLVGLIFTFKLPLLAGSLSGWPVRSLINGFAHVGLGSYTIYILHYPLLVFLANFDGGQNLGWACVSMLTLIILAPSFETWLQPRVNRSRWFRQPIPVG